MSAHVPTSDGNDRLGQWLTRVRLSLGGGLIGISVGTLLVLLVSRLQFDLSWHGAAVMYNERVVGLGPSVPTGTAIDLTDTIKAIFAGLGFAVSWIMIGRVGKH